LPFMDEMRCYIPTDRLRAMALGQNLPDRTRGSALFADISGFTPLTETLLKELGPQRGPEEVTRYLNTVFDSLITRLDRYSGSVIIFGGDAITCWFDNDDGLYAIACALEMQETMRQFARIVTPSGSTISLAMKVGISSGEVRRFLVGDPNIQVFDILAGRTLDRLTAAEHHAAKGDIVLSGEVVDELQNQVEIGVWHVEEETGRHFGVLSSLNVAVPPRPWEPVSLETLTDEQIRPWLMSSIYERLKSGQGEFLGELRPAVPIFVHFTGIDYDHDEECISKLDCFIRQAVEILAKFDGSIFAVIMGDKGSYLYTVLGAPVAHEDDPLRAAAAALEIRKMAEELNYISELKIGITYGWLYAGASGGATRRTYVAIGDEVNLSARLMQAAGSGQILVASHAWYPVQYAFTADALPPKSVKGKTVPISVYSLTGMQERHAAVLKDMGYALPMVGRQYEVKKFEQELAQVLSGRGRILGITGEAGMGKSRLAMEMIRIAQTSKMAIYGGECEAYGAHTNYLVWQGVWYGLFELDRHASLEAQVYDLERQLLQINPALLPRLPLLGGVLNLPIPDNQLTRSLDAKLRKSSLEALLVDCLHARAKTRPLMIILEDCQWMDELSHDLLAMIGRAILNMPVMLVTTYRPLQMEHLKRVLVSGLPNYVGIELGELSEQEAEELIQLKLRQLSKTQARVSPELVTRIMEKTDGNPFYIEELINYLQDRGIDPSGAGGLAQLDLPDSLYSLVLSRIDQFNESQKVTLKVASIIGRMFKAAWVYGYYPQPGDPQLTLDNLDALYLTDLIPAETSESEKSYLFKHITTQEVAYESLPYNTRSKLHGLFAHFMEEANISSLDRYIDLLAFHYGHSENTEKKREYWLMAGQASQAKHANAAAVEYYRHALELLSPADKVDVLQKLGQVLEIIGKYNEAEESYQQALELAVQQKDQRGQGLVQTALGELYRKQGRYDEAVEWLNRARVMFEALGDQEGIGRVLHFSGTVAAHRANFAEARGLYEESLVIRRALNDRANTASLLSNLGVVARAQGDLDLARTLHEEALSIRREIGDRWAIGVSLNNLGNVAVDQGRFAEASALHEEGLAIRREVGDRWAIANALNNLGNLAREQGDYQKAIRLYHESLEINHQLDGKWAIAYLLDDIACLSVLCSQPERAFRLAGAASAVRKSIGSSLSPAEQKKLDDSLEKARQSINEAEQTRLFSEGENWSLEQAVEYVYRSDD